MDSMSLKICQFALFVVFIHWTQAAIIPENNECGPECVRILQQQMALDPKFLERSCECDIRSCHCCFQGPLSALNISQEICLEAQYIIEEFELQISATLNGNDLGTFSLSGRNPPPICFPVLPIPIPLELCVQAKDIMPQGTNLHLCADLFVKLAGFKLLCVPLNCFLLGTDGIQIANDLNNVGRLC